MAQVLELGIGVAVFGVVLLALTFSTALVADLTGYFRLLFVQRPYQQQFRLLRWLVAAVAALGVITAIE